MRNYEVTFIVDPVLSGDEIKSTAQIYVNMLTDAKCKIVHNDEMGLRQLAYPINKRHSGVYSCVQFEAENGSVIPALELALRRDERIMRFLTVSLDKYGAKYNQDKRDGKIGVAKKIGDTDKEAEAVKPAPKKAAPKKEAPKKEAPKKATPPPTPSNDSSSEEE